MLTYVTHMRVSAANAAAFEAMMQELGAIVAEHEPTAVFSYGRSVNDPELFVVVDIYPDAATQAVHAKSEYVPRLMARAVKLVGGAKFDVQRYES